MSQEREFTLYTGVSAAKIEALNSPTANRMDE